MRVAVTGHLGYVGTVLTPMFVAAGHDIVGFDTDLYRASTFGDEPDWPTVEHVRKDIRDIEVADLDGFDAVVHLAGLSNDPLGDLNPALTDDINFQASVQLAERARAAGVPRFVFSSSCSNYGAGVEDELTEESEFNPVTPYGHSKVNVEKAVTKLAGDDFSPTYLRSGTAYGVSPRLRFDLVLNNLTAWAFCTGSVRLKSDGSPWRPVVHIEDMSRAFLAVVEAPRDLVHDEAFNVGRTTENYQIRDLAHIVARVVEGSKVELASDASPDTRDYRVNCDKIADTLPAFQPVWTAEKGAVELRDAYARVGVELDEFEGDRYRRVNHIKALIDEGRLDSDLRWITAGSTP
jgi:nucleoside-diphosphate-sugar epimerase